LGVRPDLITWLLTTLLALAYPAALLGVRLGRRGAGSAETVRVDRGEVRHPSVPLAPFSSSLRAQLWLEWLYLGCTGLVQALIMLLGLMAVVQMAAITLRRDPYLLAAMGVYAEALGPAWLSLSWLLMLPIAFATIGACDLGRYTRSKGKQGLPD